MQDGQKAVWSIPYISVAFFPSLKQNFIASVGCIPIAAVAVHLKLK